MEPLRIQGEARLPTGLIAVSVFTRSVYDILHYSSVSTALIAITYHLPPPTQPPPYTDLVRCRTDHRLVT